MDDLQHVPLFAGMNLGDLKKLAEAVSQLAERDGLRLYQKGDDIVTEVSLALNTDGHEKDMMKFVSPVPLQGDCGATMFVMHSGAAEAIIKNVDDTLAHHRGHKVVAKYGKC